MGRGVGALVFALGTALVAAAAALPLASAAVSPGAPADFTLSPDRRHTSRHVTSILVNDLTPAVDPSVVPTASQCRETAALDLFCDVYRFKITRDKRGEAANFVVVTVEWPTQATAPALGLGIAGLGDYDLPDLDVYLYAEDDTFLDTAGGVTGNEPERVAWEATQEEYDLVVRSGGGVGTEYRITATLSDELFARPSELLDSVLDRGGEAPEPAAVIPRIGVAPSPDAPLIPIAAIDDDDPAIRGIGLGTTEQFPAPDLRLLPHTRRVAATTEAPPTLVLIVAMLLVPAATSAVAVALLRRRRNSFAA